MKRLKHFITERRKSSHRTEVLKSNLGSLGASRHSSRHSCTCDDCVRRRLLGRSLLDGIEKLTVPDISFLLSEHLSDEIERHQENKMSYDVLWLAGSLAGKCHEAEAD